MTEQEQAPPEGLEGDLISQDQAGLDAEQGGIAAPEYVSKDDFLRMQTNYQQQIAGLQSKVDTGLNAIRRDTQAAAEERIAGEKARVREAYYAKIRESNPEQEQALREHDRYMDGLEVERAKVVAQVAPSAHVASPVSPVEETRATLRRLNIDPDLPGIDYMVLQNPTLSAYEQQVAFMTSATEAKAQAAVRAATAAPQTPATRTVTPPVEGGTQRAGGYRNIDDVYSAYTSDRISKQEYIDAARKLGVNP